MNFLARAIALFICVGLGAAYAEEAKVRVVTYGTSLTASGKWQAALQTELQRCWGRDVAVLNRAAGGKGSNWGLANVEKVAEAQPDFAIVEFAINDARLKGGSSLDTSRQQTRAIVDAIKAAQPKAKVFLMITPMVRGERAKLRPSLADYHQMYRDLASEGVAGLIDNQRAWSDIPDADIPDGVHPTPAAHRAVTVPGIVHAIAPDCH